MRRKKLSAYIAYVSKKDLKLRVWAKFETVWGSNYYERLMEKGWPESVVDLAFGVLGLLPYMR